MYVVGHHLNKTTGDKDGHLVKYSSNGTKIWERVFGGDKDEKAYEVIQSSDGSIYVIGATQTTVFDGQVNTQDWVDSETWDEWDAWECFLIKYNTDGDKEWTRLFGGSKRDKAYDLSEGVDGLIYIVGETSSPDFVGKNSVRHIRGSFFTSFTPDGEEQWTDNAFQNKHSEAIAIAKDGSIVVGGGEDVALIKYVPETVNLFNLSRTTFDENIPGGSSIASLVAGNKSKGKSYAYDFAFGSGDSDNKKFSISGDQLIIRQQPDFESKNSYSIRLKVTDSVGLTFEKPFSLSVNDRRENPTNISLSSKSFDENISSGSIVATLSTADQDSNDIFDYSLVDGKGSEDNKLFTIEGNSLIIIDSPDAESKPTYKIRIETYDSGGRT